jgi:anaerobic magnesium-protoporphyrin IX monomethyl ester cyclase
VTKVPHRDGGPLQWNEPAVRQALRSWAERARSVCLITPPWAFLLDERVFVSLGVLKVAASLEARNYRVSLLDLSGVENFLAPLEDYLAVCQDAAIGITVTTPQLPAVMRIAATVRRLRPDLRLILGGPHVTLVYSAQKLEKKRGIINGRGHRSAAQLETIFDVLCSGDGELAVFEALKDDAPRVIDGDDPKGGLFLTDEMFTDGPLPARHLVDLKSYRYSIEGHRATSLIAQLDCPFGCGFCGGRNSKSQIRNRSVDSILFEVEHLHRENGYTGFMFYDDELNVSKSFVALMNGLSDLQSRLGAEFRLRGFVKSELFTLEQATAMHRAGFRWLLCGFEAANERILINIDKRATLADNDRCVGYAKQAGLKISAERLVALRDMVERDVRRTLNIPFNSGAPAIRYEHSMGQGLPDFIHRMAEAKSSPIEPAVPLRAAAR